MEATKIDQMLKDTETSRPLASPRDHQLWVNLSALGEGNVFAVLPTLIKNYLLDGSEEMDDEFFDIILPSDNTWQTKIYYQLVEKQRMIDNNTPEMILEEEPKEQKLHEWNILPKSVTPICSPEPTLFEKKTKRSHIAPITWTVSDISKAGCLLKTPPLPVTFDDEHEMRRVYTLIYDVFRYKNVLTKALNDALFFQIFIKLEQTAAHVWLLFYDLYHRSFKKRETSVAALASKLFDSVGLSFAENALWSQRVKLAAAVSRLRIQHNALSLSELLPPHLKDEKVTEQAKYNPVTCWVNCIKVNDIKQLTDDIEKLFELKMVTDLEQLTKQKFKWDRHCPQIIAFHSSMRGKLARSQFVKSHQLIVQDKSFCRGAATFGKILDDLGLAGSVIQTHVNSPRTTAYLATLLTHNEKIKKLMAFSAGKRKTEYESYFMKLGVKNITIFSDRLIDSPPDGSHMEEVVAVFATPPNSYSAVTDPIDLVCSRGGDLSMLEVLTQSNETQEAKERVRKILDEQRKTLRFAMSRPQIQFVLYETHSELDAENCDMVNKTLRDINRLAKLQHATLQGKIGIPETPMEESISVDIREIKTNEKVQITEAGEEIGMTKRNSMDSVSSKLAVDVKEKFLETLQVPDTDIFTIPELPSLCPNESSCIDFRKEGCYLVLIQRKEIIRLDDKYMIQMAENRGLFGSTTNQNAVKSKSSRASKKKQEKIEKKPKTRKKLKDLEVRDGYSQTSDESMDEDTSPSEDEDESSKEDEEEEEEDEALKDPVIDARPSTSKNRPLSRSILGRMTSAHIRQFVSPDFKQVGGFSSPSIAFGKIERSMKKLENVSKKATNKISNSIEITLKSSEKNRISKDSVERSNTNRNKEKRKIKKKILDRLRSPTLSFMLKTKKNDPNEDTKRPKTIDLLAPLVMPCERFNRRNNLKQLS